MAKKNKKNNNELVLTIEKEINEIKEVNITIKLVIEDDVAVLVAENENGVKAELARVYDDGWVETYYSDMMIGYIEDLFENPSDEDIDDC